MTNSEPSHNTGAFLESLQILILVPAFTLLVAQPTPSSVIPVLPIHFRVSAGNLISSGSTIVIWSLGSVLTSVNQLKIYSVFRPFVVSFYIAAKEIRAEILSMLMLPPVPVSI